VHAIKAQQVTRTRRIKPLSAARFAVCAQIRELGGRVGRPSLKQRIVFKRAETVFENQLINRSLSCDAPITNAGVSIDYYCEKIIDRREATTVSDGVPCSRAPHDFHMFE
jgi:hypothetical protein